MRLWYLDVFSSTFSLFVWVQVTGTNNDTENPSSQTYPGVVSRSWLEEIREDNEGKGLRFYQPSLPGREGIFPGL